MTGPANAQKGGRADPKDDLFLFTGLFDLALHAGLELATFETLLFALADRVFLFGARSHGRDNESEVQQEDDQHGHFHRDSFSS